MNFAKYAHSHIQLVNDRISREDAERQELAAAEILRRFGRQPGLVLADEVGMGKTFVAMAVAASILIERGQTGPVIVMCPPSLREKWPKDWQVFTEKCLKGPSKNRFRAARADSGIDFLKLLDDPEDRRAHIIFLTHGALHRSIGDGFAKLAVIKRAFKGRSSLSTQRAAFGRWASRLVLLDWVEKRADGLLGGLLDRPYEKWLSAIRRADDRLKETIADDPVPRHLVEVLEEMSGSELEPLVEELRRLPQRESANLEERLKDVRRALTAAMESVWKVALQRARFTSPLLILDEAHHVKNPATRLASLFATEESAKDSKFFDKAGPLGGKFQRMLFLTATPFQLGHAELIRVLDRFEGIDWTEPQAPMLTLPEFKGDIHTLGTLLDDAQSAALRLDRAWSRLGHELLERPDGTIQDPETWWSTAQANRTEGHVTDVDEQVRHTERAMQAAEQALAPWVLRHLKSSHLPGCTGIPRRQILTGAAIRGGSHASGLEITAPVLLPFLLAGRAQTLLASSTKGRALFAEGLASSFEAYLETRSGREALDEDADGLTTELSPDLEWYLKHLDRALPKDSQDVRSAHPKVRATAERAVELWRAGEKVLIFCHYRATGRALRQHISTLLHQEIIRMAQQKLPNQNEEEILARLEGLGDKFFDDDDLRAVLTDWASGIAGAFSRLSAEHVKQVTDVVRRFVRTPSFLVRYLPLNSDDLAGAFRDAVNSPGDEQLSLRQKIEDFCRFLADRCIEGERQQFLDALDHVQTGTHFGQDTRTPIETSEGQQTDTGRVLLPNVRLANGEVRQETRRRLLHTFNTPLFPEILIASSVLAEGVDLHLNCRHVIHHDLCWNPSTLEQRSGRVDRIGSKAERVKQPIHLYMPYVAETQDEKMFRVVRDRERWFQIVMGENYEVDEAATDKRAERVPLPESVKRRLTMSLHVEPAAESIAV
jgi:superfamily II DNA or RNA helicase